MVCVWGMKLKQRVVLVVLIALFIAVMLAVSTLLNRDAVEQDAVSISRPLTPSLHSLSSERTAGTSTLRNATVEQLPSSVPPKKDAWSVWREWVTPDFLYPDGAFNSDEMDDILRAMAASPITSWELGYKGTQLKTTAMLGNQRTVFKPKR